jgi:hypothetical protein
MKSGAFGGNYTFYISEKKAPVRREMKKKYSGKRGDKAA